MNEALLYLINMESKAILKDINAGKLPLKELRRNTGSELEAANIRIDYLESKYGGRLDKTRQLLNNNKDIINYEESAARNIENHLLSTGNTCVGFIEVTINGKEKPVFVATTEGALVSSMSRGARTINKSGGAKVIAMDRGMTRSVLIGADDIFAAEKINEFVKSADGKAFLSEKFSETTRHGRLMDVQTYGPIGSELFMIFRAKTGAAMGMNMVTIGANNATEKLLEKFNSEGTSCELITQSANMCTDKKPTHINVLRGRGVYVSGEVTITNETVSQCLKIEPESLVRINYLKNYVGGMLAGTIGANSNIANTIAATFLAYGQDMAQVVESSIGFDNIEMNKEKNGIKFSINIPALEVGTYGGGTRTELAQEYLKFSGVYGENDVDGSSKLDFAKMICGAAMSLELSTLSALATGTLANAHAKLKRG